MEGNKRVKVMDMLPACLLMIVQPPDDDVLSKTELESDEEDTIVSNPINYSRAVSYCHHQLQVAVGRTGLTCGEGKRISKGH